MSSEIRTIGEAVDLKKLSKEHLKDATHLLKKKRWAGAYYLAGYAVECALKACVINRISTTAIIFEERRFAEKCFTHDFEILFDVANLKIERDLEIASNPVFAINWNIVNDWNEQSRYYPRTEEEAIELLSAIADSTHGILPWIQKRW